MSIIWRVHSLDFWISLLFYEVVKHKRRCAMIYLSPAFKSLNQQKKTIFPQCVSFPETMQMLNYGHNIFNCLFEICKIKWYLLEYTQNRKLQYAFCKFHLFSLTFSYSFHGLTSLKYWFKQLKISFSKPGCILYLFFLRLTI